MKYLTKLNKNIYESLTFMLFIISTLLTYIIGELYFFVSNSTDFNKYIKYIEYFQFTSDSTYTGQGLIYYYLVSLVSFLRKNEATNLNYSNFINSNVHLTNFLLYLIGIYGFYKLLSRYNYSKTSIFLSFTVLNFSLPIFIMRSILKPEILAFSLLPWIYLGLKLYFEKPTLLNFIYLTPLISIILNIKGSITGMVALLLFASFYKYIGKNYKLNIFCFLLTLLSFFIIFNENSKVNDYNVFEHNLSEEIKYNNKATLNFFNTINFRDLYFFPVSPYHNNSAVGITLLDTFGDYFNIFTNYDEHLFFHKTSENFLNQIEDPRGFRLGNYIINYWAIILTVIFYFCAFVYSYKYRKKWTYYLAPLFGIFIVSLSALGIPFNHFDPNVGDTLKTNYYSFLIGFSIIFITATYFQNKSFLKIITLFSFIFMFFISLGFPKENQNNINFYLQEKIELSPLCVLSSKLVEDFESQNCFDREIKFCDYNLASNEAKNVNDEKIKIISLSSNNKIIFLDDDKKIYAESFDVCSALVSDNYLAYNPQLENLRPLPFFNFVFIISSVFSIIFLSLVKKENYSL